MAYVTIKHGDTVLGELNDGDGLKLNTRGTAIDPSTGEYVGLFIREDIEIDVDYPNQYNWTTGNSCLCFTANTAESTISMTTSDTPTLNQNFLTSIDGGITWQDFFPDSTTITLSNVGDKVYFKGDNPNGVGQSISSGGMLEMGLSFNFVMTGSIAASGDIMSLIDDGACNTNAVPGRFCFYYMFSDCSALTSAPKLTATTLSYDCYSAMFMNCTNLAIAPKLVASTLSYGCYSHMFSGCTSLLSAPDLLTPSSYPATCFGYMFLGCTSLINPPRLSDVVTSNDIMSFASMFENCTSLVIPPSLLFLTECGWMGCMAMFKNCASLAYAPIINIRTNNGGNSFEEMFYGCSSLKVYSTSGIGHEIPWMIPNNGNWLSSSKTMTDMFTGCAGSRSTNSPTFDNNAIIYYTQNTPV